MTSLARNSVTSAGRLFGFGGAGDVPEGFLRENRVLFLSRTRILILVGIGLLLASIPVDYLRVPPDRYPKAVALRLLGCTLLLLLFLMLSRSFAERWAEWLAGAVVIVLGAITIALAPLFAAGAADPNYAILVMGTVFLVMGSGLLLPFDGPTMALLGGILLLFHVAFTIDFAPGQNFPALFATFAVVSVTTVGVQQLFAGRLGEYRARLAQEMMSEVRRDFVAMLTHDIKNPLSAVMGFTEILRDQLLEGVDPKETIDHIESSAQQAMTLAINFLDAERIESGVLQLHRKPISLETIVEHVLRHQAPRARLRRVVLRSDLSAEVPSLDLDGPLVDRVFVNLVSNAIAYSPGGAEVVVTIRRRDQRVVVEVLDHGPGIPLEGRSRLFQRYSRGASSRADSTGLGLFVVRTIVEAHGGSVEARFPPEGGSIFEVSFPIGRETASR